MLDHYSNSCTLAVPTLAFCFLCRALLLLPESGPLEPPEQFEDSDVVVARASCLSSASTSPALALVLPRFEYQELKISAIMFVWMAVNRTVLQTAAPPCTPSLNNSSLCAVKRILFLCSCWVPRSLAGGGTREVYRSVKMQSRQAVDQHRDSGGT